MCSPTKRCPCGGIMLLVFGILFLLNNFEVLQFSFGQYWPLILIVWGLHSLLPCGKDSCCNDSKK